MRIGVLYTRFYPLSSSASAHGYHLFSNLLKRGHTLHTLGMGENPLSTDHPKTIKGVLSFMKNIDVLYIRINPWGWFDWFSVLKWLSFGRIKVIWEVNAPVEEALGKITGTPTPSLLRKLRQQNFRRKMLSHLCNGTISVSNVLKQYCISTLHAAENTSIPNGSAHALFVRSPLNQPHPMHAICSNKFVVVWAGNNHYPWQGTAIMMEVAEKMAAQDPDVVFVAFGPVSVYGNTAPPNVFSFGEINSSLLPSFLSFAHVGLCLYNSYEWSPIGFYNSPLKLYDYLSMELVVIGSDMGQISETIQHGYNGFLTNNSAADIAGKIRYARDSYAELEELRKNARDTVVNKYNWEAVAKETEDFMEKCMK